MKIIFLLFLATVSFVVAQQKDWWQTANFYQIYPRSFKSAKNNRTGDIRGIIEKLPYLKELGVTATWLSPILKSPQVDNGYDIADFKEVDPLFGTNADLEELFKKAKESGIKVIMDFVPNHTSDEHDWFVRSKRNETKYRDYYIWHPGKINPQTQQREEPNNWQAVFATRAWTWNEDRKMYYLHQFAAGQPDLNYRNPDVVKEMKDVLTHWMDMGADGFRIDAINHLFEVEDLRDEPRTFWTDDPTNYGYTHHYYTKDLDETYEMVSQWRDLIDKYNADHPGSTRVLFTEAYANLTFTMKYYKDDKGKDRAHFPFNFLLIENLNENSSAKDFKDKIDEYMKELPEDATPNWVLGNHDKPRVGTRYGTDRIDGMLALLLLLPGVAVTYNGDEIGMLDYRDGISWKQTQDPQACNTKDLENFRYASRDPARTPFQWDDSDNAGFCSSCEPWLPVNSNYKKLNLAAQKNDTDSFFKFYQRLSTLRTDAVFQNGGYESHVYNEKVFAFKRAVENKSYLVLINFGSSPQTFNVNDMKDLNFSDKAKVVTAGSRTCYNEGDIVDTKEFRLNPFNALVIENSAKTAFGSLVLLVVGILLSRFI